MVGNLLTYSTPDKNIIKLLTKEWLQNFVKLCYFKIEQIFMPKTFIICRIIKIFWGYILLVWQYFYCFWMLNQNLFILKVFFCFQTQSPMPKRDAKIPTKKCWFSVHLAKIRLSSPSFLVNFCSNLEKSTMGVSHLLVLLLLPSHTRVFQ